MGRLLRIIVWIIFMVTAYRYRYQMLNSLIGINLVRRLIVARKWTIPEIRKLLLEPVI